MSTRFGEAVPQYRSLRLLQVCSWWEAFQRTNTWYYNCIKYYN